MRMRAQGLAKLKLVNLEGEEQGAKERRGSHDDPTFGRSPAWQYPQAAEPPTLRHAWGSRPLLADGDIAGVFLQT